MANAVGAVAGVNEQFRLRHDANLQYLAAAFYHLEKVSPKATDEGLAPYRSGDAGPDPRPLYRKERGD